MFTHLHVHSHYSLLDGLGKIDDLIARAQEDKMKSLALTDHGTMYGTIEFYQKALASGIKPILGIEAYIAPGKMTDRATLGEGDKRYYHLLLLAKNELGYKNLIKITTEAHLKGFYYKPRIDLKHLAKYSKGLIAGSACLGGEIPRKIISGQISAAKESIKNYQKIFGRENFYLELQHHPNIPLQAKVNNQIEELSKKLNIPLIATSDAHYVNKDDGEAQEILLCLQNKVTLDTPNRSLSMIDEDFSLTHLSEMEENFKHIPQALENTGKIADLCNVEIELGKIKLPYFAIPKEHKTDHDYLIAMSRDGLSKRYDWENLDHKRKKAIEERLDFELSVIQKTGFSSYFLIVQDFVNWAKDQGIAVGPGRGSAAGSLVAYLLKITDLDPIDYELFFERFLNPERISMPDIDLDFADHRRDEVLDYVREKYGNDHVAQIITFGTMAARAAVRDTGRALSMPYSFCDEIAKLVPMFTGLEEALEKEPDLKSKYNNEPEVKKLIDTARKLEGVARHASTHACGVVITKEPLDEVTPTQFASASDKSIVTQYEMHAIEDLGLLKMDFLGLKNLTIIEKTLNIINKIHSKEIDISKITLEDPKTFELLSKAQTTGVFQLESSGMKRYLKELKPTEIEDIIAMVSLYRPGPMEYIPDYIAGKHGTKQISYLHPKLEPILAKTYGVAIYQEQILQIARDIAGFTLGEADVLRRAIGKKIKELLDEQKEKFVEGCVAEGHSKELGKKLFSFIEPFARYGFNRSHAACYAMIGYQTAYLKANFPTAFMAALLSCDKENMDRVAIEVNECRTMGIEVLAPDVNESFTEFTVVKNADKPTIRFGLGAIKNLGSDVIKAIIKARKKDGSFSNLVDFLTRVEHKGLNKKSVEALAKCGALESLEVERNQVLTNIEKILEFTRASHKNLLSGQNDLFSGTGVELAAPKLQLDASPASPKEQNLKWEKELLGLYISDHPLKKFTKFLNEKATLCQNVTNQMANKPARIGGVVTTLKKIFTKKGDPMIFVTIEDFTGSVEVIVFPTVLEKTKDIWQDDAQLIVQGTVSDKDGEIKILADQVLNLTEETIKQPLPELTVRENSNGGWNNGGSSGFNGQNNNQPTPSFKPAYNGPSRQAEKTATSLTIKILNTNQENTLNQIKDVLLDQPGFSRVYLVITQNDQEKKIETGFRVNITPDILDRLRTINNIEVTSN